jgi:hypothetical protein
MSAKFVQQRLFKNIKWNTIFISFKMRTAFVDIMIRLPPIFIFYPFNKIVNQ